MTLTQFKDLAAGLQSIAIVVAALLGGAWAVFQFLSLRALEKAKLELAKAKRDLFQQGIIVTKLSTTPVGSSNQHFVHVSVAMRNIGTSFEVLDWANARLIARRVEKTDRGIVHFSLEEFVGQRGSSAGTIRLEPGYSMSRSFLIPLPGVGVYFAEFSIPSSQIVASGAIEDLKQAGITVDSGLSFGWKADTFFALGTGEAAPPGVAADALKRVAERHPV